MEEKAKLAPAPSKWQPNKKLRASCSDMLQVKCGELSGRFDLHAGAIMVFSGVDVVGACLAPLL